MKLDLSELELSESFTASQDNRPEWCFNCASTLQPLLTYSLRFTVRKMAYHLSSINTLNRAASALML